MHLMKDVCEYIVIEITLNDGNSVIVTSLYRPPDSNVETFNKTFINIINSKKKMLK